jgi:hypothetical protein
MNGLTRETRSSPRVATVGALTVMLGLGLVSDLLFVATLQLRPDWFANPALLVGGGPASADLLKGAALADLFS